MQLSASLRLGGVRAGTTVAAAVAIAGVTVIGAPAAYAAPGDSGDLSVSSAGWHSRGENGVEVCAFNLVATNFESYPSVPWTITAQPPTTPPGDTLASTLPLVNGAARSDRYLLPEGTYQLVWTVPSGPKQRAFKVDCAQRGDSNRPAEIGPGANGANRENGENGESGEKGGEYRKPSGAVPAGAGGVPDMENLGTENESSLATPAALTVGAAGVAALVMVRRSARRRARNEA
ncbi:MULTISPECIES: hypothetical protein [unclassified Streptomyces]|uniref:hypothetical protein n=1 Tax=unclassified Streptomyces TaxID=2593676 RepID=UPI0028C4ABA9|nr:MULTISPECIES: hypothetical protein [unclassified Streptomyces]WNO70456.1 hypothetical protein RPQ07_01940 [Streptomyces sp. AM8-1-1]